MSKKRILLVEDEKHLADTIKLNLEIEDYHPISWFTTVLQQ